MALALTILTVSLWGSNCEVQAAPESYEIQKESIRVLDIEPTKYSLLKEETIRTWLEKTGDSSHIEEIHIDQTTTAEFIGKMVDLVEEYDLIYIGSCIGNGSDRGSMNQESGKTIYNDTTLNGLIYSDLGDIATVSSEFGGLLNTDYDESGKFLDKNVETRYSGNDITDMKKLELTEYVNNGYPIVVSSELFEKDGTTIDKDKVRESSNMYTFMTTFTGENAVGNVISDDAEKIEGSELLQYVNAPKLELTMVTAPKEYTEGDAKAALEKQELSYTFEFEDLLRISNEESLYRVQLFVDANADGQFSPQEELYELKIQDDSGKLLGAEEIKPGERYTVTKELSSVYEGIVSWKLQVSTINKEENEPSRRDSATGQAFIQPKNAIEINALQLAVSESGIDLSEEGSDIQNLFDELRNKKLYDIKVEMRQQQAYLQECQKFLEENSVHTAKEFYEKYFNEYDMLILGFSEGYADADTGSYDAKVIDTAIEAIELFVESGKSVVFSHDTTSYSNNNKEDKSNYWGYRLNQCVRTAAAMDRYNIVETQTDITAGMEGFNNIILDKNTTQNKKSLVYPLNENGDTTFLVSQVNKGQITSYPFDVNVNMEENRDETRDNYMEMSLETQMVSPTHAQYYQLNLDYDRDQDGKSDVIVWYSLAGYLEDSEDWEDIFDNWGDLGDWIGGLVGSADTSSAYTAMPNDVRNNYYIYSVGNVTYTGMGHSETMTEYETKLFVNTIIAAYNLRVKEPEVSIIEDANDKNSSLDEIYSTYDEDAQIYCEENEIIYFYIQDGNMINGSKNFEIKYYYEVPVGVPDTVEWTDGNGNTVYLKELDFEPKDVTSDTVYSVTIPSGVINQIFGAQGEMKIYIGVRTTLNYESQRQVTTDWSFDTLTIKKRILFNLD